MAKFSYSARTKQGKRESGVLEVTSRDELVTSLQERGLIVTKVISLDKKPSSLSEGRQQKFTHRRVKLYDLLFFARQLATLLDSGITLHKSIDTLLKQIDSSALYKIISQVKKDIVKGGGTLRDALSRHPRVFSDLWVNLVESGEASGNLALVLERLAKYLEMQANFRRTIVSALIYPAILFIVAIGAVLFFVIKIVPTFAELFKSLGLQLPPLTRLLIDISGVVGKIFIPALIILVVFYSMFRQFRRTDMGSQVIDTFKLKIPVFGDFFKLLAVERFTSEMATMIEGGVPILYALEITERSVGNKVLEGIIKNVKTKVREGNPLADLLDGSDFFEPMLVQMVSVGEEVGELAKMLRRISDFYDERVETFIGRFATIFEPVMLVFMGGVIGVMLIALFLPIFSIASAGGVSF